MGTRVSTGVLEIEPPHDASHVALVRHGGTLMESIMIQVGFHITFPHVSSIPMDYATLEEVVPYRTPVVSMLDETASLTIATAVDRTHEF